MKTQSLLCCANLKQIGIALNSYVDVNRAYPPGFCDLPGYKSPQGKVGDPAYDWHGWWWFHFLSEYDVGITGAKKTLVCPVTSTELQSDSNFLLGKYGINYSICKIAALKSVNNLTGPSLKSTDIPVPSRTFLALDAGYALTYWTAAQLNPSQPFEITKRANSFFIPGLNINQGKTIHTLQAKDAINGRHPKKSINILYCDGHVENQIADQLVIDDLQPRLSTSFYSWSILK